LADDTITETWTFTVWPELPPTVDGQFIPLDAAVIPEIHVQAGETFYVWLDEKQYFPNGFGWMEPTHEFACVKVLNTNYGDYNRGYRVWLVEANRAVCQETVPLTRPAWWTEEPKTGEIKIFVNPITCPSVCEIGKRQATATSCDCVPIETEPVHGILF